MDITIELKAVVKNGKVVLRLKDSEGHDADKSITTDASPGDTIIWKLANNSNISEIVNVYKKTESQDVFSPDPHKDTDVEWQGTISETASGTESYNIKFIYEEDGKVYTDDPKVVIKPPTT